MQHSIANLSRGSLPDISSVEQTSAEMVSCRRALDERMSQLFVCDSLSRSRCHSGFRAHADSLEINLVHPGCHDAHGPNIPHSTCSSGGGNQAALRDRRCVSRCRSASPPFQLIERCWPDRTTGRPRQTGLPIDCQRSGSYLLRPWPVHHTYHNNLFIHAPSASILVKGCFVRVCKA